MYALKVYDDGNGASLYASGAFPLAGGTGVNPIAQWDGATWIALGTGLNDISLTLATYDDGNGEALYAGGDFINAGGVNTGKIARWDGTSWAAASASTGQGLDGRVRASTVYDDGSGPALYVGGSFTKAGSVSANNIARWDGSSWSTLGDGTDDSVYALGVYDDGTGPALFAGGRFKRADGTFADRIAKWNGTTWSSIGSQSAVRGEIYDMAVYDDGNGPALYVTGAGAQILGDKIHAVAKWDSTGWSPLGDPTEGLPANGSG